ncbi:MAG: hypothetical protein E5X22_19355 [Mesorhizobium sp.]|nr:MAG: hypothetical protein EOQ76_15890 [Mesorhizobium sp.]RWH34762.1 MAG: hypothetical protein EOQ79_23970 [Mesorhizobium sp.]RWM90673.1 MAG: hypothetical protein EOR86_27315 [Mesorhizobium sp.]TIM70561.1 MAG: hypothetical protein E5Y52_01920 [Mesorhizobium sp.]TIR58398.1 MAG: hypothetical protein E5X22_19355 [Mesorhizobium sp.]
MKFVLGRFGGRLAQDFFKRLLQLQPDHGLGNRNHVIPVSSRPSLPVDTRRCLSLPHRSWPPQRDRCPPPFRSSNERRRDTLARRAGNDGKTRLWFPRGSSVHPSGGTLCNSVIFA